MRERRRETMRGHRVRKIGWLAGLAVVAELLPGGAGAGVVIAHAARPLTVAARTISLYESAHMRLTSKHGFTLNEQGSASGTTVGTIYLHLTIASINRVTAEVNIYPRGGSITGYAKARITSPAPPRASPDRCRSLAAQAASTTCTLRGSASPARSRAPTTQ